MHMKKLQPYIIALGIIAIGIGIGRMLGSGNGEESVGPKTRSTRLLEVTEVNNGTVQRDVRMSGKAVALRRIELYAEVGGIFTDAGRPFREGAVFRKGEALFGIRDDVYRNSVLAEKSQLLNQLTLLLPDLLIDFPGEAEVWKEYLEGYSIEAPLAPLPEVRDNRLRNYIAARGIYSKFFAVRSMEETLGKYRLQAPFDGVVTLSNLNPGMLVRTGQKIGEFADPSVFEVQAAVSVRALEYVRPGDRVELRSDDFPGVADGQISRINQAIDQQTQTVGVYIEVADPRVREGMFMYTSIAVPVEHAVQVSRSLLRDETRLFVVRDSVLTLADVEVVAAYGQHAIVRGLSEGAVMLAEPREGLYEGMVLDPAELHFITSKQRQDQ
ncbi:efflux RND transporter periplasmic adaptor subunit [Prosthecochloris vibrioformis]|uniref:HlyD family efflux transporter periplasmic adaptor subunit n=1 Tax=Prosthecochloris vibrioformis TaxID=1098 RepID=A0A5C4RZC0_PROVB|nr:HlyD family efflux transporter periplasmic adaptor subunit [Prosthecochloris vibrioformis]TNJ36011.1 HlyD family efflux transporter periplasmic adaptor subunit [Prosthecochloris vibrioformis]